MATSSNMNLTEDIFNDIDMGSDDDENIQFTPAQIVQLVEEAWVNEKFAPEILPHKSEIVECLLTQISCMEENLQTLPATDFKKGIHQMEIDRLRFLVSSYLRSRLEKIEIYYMWILKQEEQRREKNEEGYLTGGELTFAREYANSLGAYFEKILTIHPLVSTEDWKNYPVMPNINSFVFLKSKVEMEGVAIDEANEGSTDVADFKKGSQLIISYNSIANLVKKGDVCLI